MTYTFKKTYHAGDVNTTFAYDFLVPEETESIELFIEVKQPKCTDGRRPDLVGVGIRHKDEVRAWNCTHKKYMKLAKEYGSAGTIPGPIDSGKWEVVIFPRTKSEIIWLEVNVTVLINEKQGRYVKGDPHNHTWHSDGRLRVDEMAAMAKKNGLDYIFIADHNIASANQSLPKDAGILVGPGVEYGLEAGHALLLGVNRPIKDFTWDPGWSCYEEHLKEALDNGASIGINHPFWEDTSWDVGFHLPYHWVEVWNGHWRPHNQKAVDWWQGELCKGKRIPVIGGSDCHGGIPESGTPTTHAWVEKIGVKEIIESYKKGHVYITAQPSGPKLSFYAEDTQMGGVSKEEKCYIQLGALKERYEIRVISQKHTHTYRAGGTNFSLELKNDGAIFLRVEVWDEEQLVLLSNPLYFEH